MAPRREYDPARLARFREKWTFFAACGYVALLRQELGRDGLIRTVREDVLTALEKPHGRVYRQRPRTYRPSWGGPKGEKDDQPWMTLPLHDVVTWMARDPRRLALSLKTARALAWLETSFG